jgi:hypothetical protein
VGQHYVPLLIQFHEFHAAACRELRQAGKVERCQDG